jgi:lipopolysaccharide/colanic/teichoic acid biosynthesis glycosyltransferase
MAAGMAKRLFDALRRRLMSRPRSGPHRRVIKIEDGGRSSFAGRRARAVRFAQFRRCQCRSLHRTDSIGGTIRDHPGRARFAGADELPQLWNIFRGDMSFVGPRALRPGEIEVNGRGDVEKLEDVPGFADRCTVRPGLTGVAQIYAPRDVVRRQKFRYDRFYIRRQSFWFDLRLIMLSFWITFRGQWEARDRKL